MPKELEKNILLLIILNNINNMSNINTLNKQFYFSVVHKWCHWVRGVNNLVSWALLHETSTMPILTDIVVTIYVQHNSEKGFNVNENSTTFEDNSDESV